MNDWIVFVMVREKPVMLAVFLVQSAGPKVVALQM
jgi:hypothetical protein